MVAIRDETEEGIREITIGVEQVKDALEQEVFVGRNRRPRRRTGGVGDLQRVEDWDVLGTAGEKVEGPTGRFFVVRIGKGKISEKPQVKEIDGIVDENA